jgi:hypothetical protein
MKKSHTSDGITQKHWNALTTIAANIANASAASNALLCKSETTKLLNYLDELEAIYGKLPSIIATRADYTINKKLRIKFLKEALSLAVKIKDHTNITLIEADLKEDTINS